ncbi:transcription initiation protein SPT3 homolog isoform X2 [Solenopsis invicta]|nr:transcription initiation protein SPT3 homolog isoform X2 [Solenopsis invicta]XP_039315129.1 transcription initiation protein SPT3 homolog isoform X2 [Solenopsis invicta]
MMHGFGDSSEPLYESAKIIEDVVLQQMKTIVKKACEIADRDASSKKINIINGEDLLFLMRKDKVKLQRIMKYLQLKELGSSVQKLINSNDSPHNVTETEKVDGTSKKMPFQNFLEQIDNTGELLENSASMDEVKRRRCIRADIASRSMDETHYMKFSKARRVSFANKNRHKFSDWICLDGDMTMSKQAYTILSYLAYETVAQIVDLAFLVRQDQGKMHGDAIDRQRFNYVNPYTFKRYHSKNFVMKALTPSEITEALRRYWSPQLDMTGPFNRWSMRKPHLKLLSC